MPSPILIHADSMLSPDMYVATDVNVGDPFTYIEVDGRRIIVTNQLEVDQVRRDSTATEVWMVDEFGGRDLVRSGWDSDRDSGWEAGGSAQPSPASRPRRSRRPEGPSGHSAPA